MLGAYVHESQKPEEKRNCTVAICLKAVFSNSFPSLGNAIPILKSLKKRKKKAETGLPGQLVELQVWPARVQGLVAKGGDFRPA